jgi:hypothetical protein
MTLAREIYTRCCAETLFQSEGEGITEEELTLITAYAFVAADTFNIYEDMTHEERKRHTISCAAKLAATL